MAAGCQRALGGSAIALPALVETDKRLTARDPLSGCGERS
jgi:hypothetical protein